MLNLAAFRLLISKQTRKFSQVALHKNTSVQMKKSICVHWNNHRLRLTKQWTFNFLTLQTSKYIPAFLVWFLRQKNCPKNAPNTSNLQDEHIYKICLKHSVQMLVRQYIAHSIKEKEKEKSWRAALKARPYILQKKLQSFFWTVFAVPSLPANWKKRRKVNIFICKAFSSSSISRNDVMMVTDTSARWEATPAVRCLSRPLTVTHCSALFYLKGQLRQEAEVHCSEDCFK